MKQAFSAVLSLFIFSGNVLSEDLDKIFTKVKEYTEQKNYTKALEELAWAKREIEKLNSKKVETFLPETLGGFTGGKVESNSVMGITNIERDYKKGSQSVKASLTGGSAGGAGGGLAAFGKMAAMFGAQEGTDTVRIKGRTATVEETDGSASITVFLDSGSMLKFEMYDSPDTAILKTMAEEIDLDSLDGYLKGAN